MTALALLLIPMVLGGITLFFLGEDRRLFRRKILCVGAVLHALGTASLHVPGLAFGEFYFITCDSLGLLFLSLTSALFLAASFYSIGYFHKVAPQSREGVSHLYVPCMLFFLAAMTLTALTTHLGVLWVAIEATTLASAPLIYYHHHPRALEATWKYFLICSVGIALALLGIFFIAAASKAIGSNLSVTTLAASAHKLDPRWLRIGFILALVGFGTKMGLAPLHNWLPDAHSEAPSPVSALLSGALLNCAFLGILRCYQICLAAGLGPFANRLFLLFGLLSLFVAAVFIVAQKDYKRLLAYSSIEHMGLLSLGVGVGSGFGTLLHLVNHSAAKGVLFLTAGHLVLTYQTKKSSEVQGLLKTMPASGWLLTVGGLAILGSPPFGLFVSEFVIFRDALHHGHFVASALALLFLAIIFVAMSQIFLGMLGGEKRELKQPMEKRKWLIGPPLVLAAVVCLLGVYLPDPLVSLIREAWGLLGGPR